MLSKFGASNQQKKLIPHMQPVFFSVNFWSQLEMILK